MQARPSASRLGPGGACLLHSEPWPHPQEPRRFAQGQGPLALQYSCLENPMDGGACWATVHGIAQSRTQLSNFTFTFHFHALEKEMATHQCSCLENPRDGGAWWAATYGFAQSQTQLKRLSSSSSIVDPEYLFTGKNKRAEQQTYNRRKCGCKG